MLKAVANHLPFVSPMESVDAAALQLYGRLTADDVPAFLKRPVREAMASLEAAVRLYSKDSLLLSFNGGKDATVVLHVARAVFAAKGLGPPRCVYWVEKERFAEVHDFVMATVEQHALPLLTYTCSFGEGLRDCVETHGVASVVLGTRQSDPKAQNAEFEPSSPGWPSFMRVNPIMSWDYGGEQPRWASYSAKGRCCLSCVRPS